LEGYVSTPDAQVFARALYDALIGGALRSLREAAGRLESVPGNSPEERVAMALPADAPREVRNFLQALAHEDALDRLPVIVRFFERYSQGEAQALNGEVISAVELDEEQKNRIVDELRGRYGERLNLRFSVDASLIGGLIIRIGDQVLDNSLRTRLSAIQRNMLTS
jgi:F-type H+-transporting ATPase subunit delta